MGEGPGPAICGRMAGGMRAREERAERMHRAVGAVKRNSLADKCEGWKPCYFSSQNNPQALYSANSRRNIIGIPSSYLENSNSI